jgi:hypothetical protein
MTLTLLMANPKEKEHSTFSERLALNGHSKVSTTISESLVLPKAVIQRLVLTTFGQKDWASQSHHRSNQTFPITCLSLLTLSYESLLFQPSSVDFSASAA